MPKPRTYSSVVFLGNYLPRQCGIATFTADLCEAVAREAPELDCYAVAMNDTPEGYAYPARVRFDLFQNDLEAYRQLADFLNMGGADIVCIQHEYGIFGGPAGLDLLVALRRLKMPIVTTLHTVLREPDDHQRRAMDELVRLSDLLVVMSDRSIELLRDIWQVPAEKIQLIHHGIPDMPFVDPNFYKDKFAVEGRRVILTFGLLSPNKGIEYMIEALPGIVERFPDVVYIVLGVTHPHVKRVHGEEYRLSLQRRARALGVHDHVVFQNRFVELSELCEFLGSADLYVTPYLGEQQVVSGTLAYALGVGKAVVSSPYWYARDMLTGGRGRVVPFRDAAALAAAAIDLFENEAERHAMRKRAYAFGRQMIWKEVARNYLGCFQRVSDERQGRPKTPAQVETARQVDIELPDVNLRHLLRLTDSTGVLQHARFSIPNYAEGYTTDDNARALAVAVRSRDFGPDGAELRSLAGRYLAFLEYAFQRDMGRFHNFLSYDRRWLDDSGSEDSHGRAIMGLGYAVELAVEDGQVTAAMNLFNAAMPAVDLFTSPRAWAFTLIGIHEYLKRFPGDSSTRRMREVLATRLHGLLKSAAADDWFWFEDSLNYANARLCQALLVAAKGLGREDMAGDALRALDWLARLQTNPRGGFSPVGSNGWHRRGGTPARFAQQPLEAQTMIEACREAHIQTGERRWREEMRMAFDWFFGGNELGVPLYDAVTRGCCDGLEPHGVNMNQGAESTLAFLLSLLTMHATEIVAKEAP